MFTRHHVYKVCGNSRFSCLWELYKQPILSCFTEEGKMMMCSYFLLFSDYMAHLVEVQHERGATGGQTFHSLLTASLPARRGTTWDSLNIRVILQTSLLCCC